jgi:hypothetical protein
MNFPGFFVVTDNIHPFHGLASITNKLVLGGSAMWAGISAVDANWLSAWAAALVAAAALVWAMVRDQRQKDRREARMERWEGTIQAIREETLKAGKPDPFPGGVPPLYMEMTTDHTETTVAFRGRPPVPAEGADVGSASRGKPA